MSKLNLVLISFETKYRALFLIIPLILSAFTHLWNPIGYPYLEKDESIYIRRAMHVLEGQGAQLERFFYDHPYFGQLFLAAVFKMIGYPNSLKPSIGDIHSIELIYLVPRILMGILAIIDTFLIYKICERRYNRNIGLFASVLFAVMPVITWLLRWILLESIQLPFVLSSLLFTLYVKGSKNNNKNDNILLSKGNDKINNKIIITKDTLLVLLSGIFLGLAIFTKVPAVTMIPLVGFLIYRNNNMDLKAIGLWFIPVILIPLIWPAYAASVGQLGDWMNGIHFQSQRSNTFKYWINGTYFRIDPVLFTLGMAGLVFAVIRKDFFILLWIIPFLIFVFFIGWILLFHVALLLPAFCIASSRLIESLSNKISMKKARQIFPYAIISAIGSFGMIETTILIIDNVNYSFFETTAFLTNYLQNNNSINKSNHVNDITVISSPIYSWIPQYVFHLEGRYLNYYDVATDLTDFNANDIQTKTKKVILISDREFRTSLSTNNKAALQIQEIYNLNSTKNIVAIFEDNLHSYYKIFIYQFDYNPSVRFCTLENCNWLHSLYTHRS